ncbi:MAG TPA: DUF4157 domain-containing protein, partial [Anaerolineae bacterium]|nr:DUF4157 domain-containing protein [Anaerolineae bacterium]
MGQGPVVEQAPSHEEAELAERKAGAAPQLAARRQSLQRAMGNRRLARLLDPNRALDPVTRRHLEAALGQDLPAGQAQAGETPSHPDAGRTVQRETGPPREAEPAGVPPIVDEVLRSGGRPLDPATRSLMEPLFGHDFGDVRVHTDSAANESAGAVHAVAYTAGPNIVFGADRYSPHTEEGRSLLAHELAHVVQQGGALSGELSIGPADDPFEREARDAEHALDRDRKASLPRTALPNHGGQALGVVQRKPLPGAGEPVGEALAPVSSDEWGDDVEELVQDPGTSLTASGAAAPDDPEAAPGINKQKVHDANRAYWTRYNLEAVRPLRDINPFEQPNAYANRTLEAQRLLRASGRGTSLIGKRLARDGILGPRTLLVLRLVALTPELAELRFEIAGLGFDLEAIASGEAALGVRLALIEVHKLSFIAEWRIETPGELVFDHMSISDETSGQQWFDDILFGGPVPAHLANRDFSLGDRLAVLRRAYEGVTFQGVAGLVEVRRSFLDEKLDNRTLVARDKAMKKRTKWVSYKAENEGALTKWTGIFALTFPKSRKVTRALEEIKAQEKLEKEGILTGLLFTFYLPELTEEERLRLGFEVEKYLKDKKESIELFVYPRGHDLIDLLLDEDEKWYLFAARLERILDDFIGRPQLFEALIHYLEVQEDRNYFELLIERAERMRVVPSLAMLVQLLLNSRYSSHPGTRRVIARLDTLKRSYRRHEYVAGDNPGVRLDKDEFLAVGEVAGGIYRTEESRYMLKEEPRRLLEAEMEAQAAARLDEIMTAEGENPYAGMSDEDFTMALLEAAAKKVGITDDHFKEVSYEESLRLKGIKSEIINGVEEFFVDFEVVGRFDGGKWQVIEPSTGYRPQDEFADRLFWYYFQNVAEAIETLAVAELIVVGGFVAWSAGATGFLVSLAGGKAVVGISVALSVLIYVITNFKHLTVEGFLKAVLEGYLGALGFRLFAPAGAGLARLVGTATFKRKLIGLALQGTVVGGGTGAITGPAMLFVDDVLRGELRSPEAYVRAMTMGMLFGIVAEFAGSAIIAPIFRTAGRNVLEKIVNIRQLKALIDGSGIKVSPSQWSAQMTGGLSRFKAWLADNLDKEIAAKIFAKAREKTREFIDSYLTGLELTVHRQALDLAEIALKPEAIDGLERLIRTTAGKMDRDAVSDILNQLVKRGDRANPYLALIDQADDDLLQRLTRNDGLQDLATADSILTVMKDRPGREIANLLDLRFNAAVNDFEDFARGLLSQSDTARARVLDLLNTRGSSVTPESLLRVAQAGVELSDELVDGLSRMVRASKADIPGLEKFLRYVPDDQMEAFLRLMKDAPQDQFDDFLKLSGDPARAARLLRYTDNPADLYRLMQATGQKLDELDKLFQATTARAPADVEALLARNAGDAVKVRRLVEQVGGDAALLERSIVWFGSQANVERILAKAAANPVTAGKGDSMAQLLHIAQADGQKSAKTVADFIEQIHVSQGGAL